MVDSGAHPNRSAGGVLIRNVHLAYLDPVKARTLYDVLCVSNNVQTIAEAGEDHGHDHDRGLPVNQSIELNANGQAILLPSLCHAHVHLDKCFLLDKCGELVTGDFQEALKLTAEAKGHFPSSSDDLYNRGKRLIVESIESGVTCIRAHVEVDTTVQLHCLNAGLKLKKNFENQCDVQISEYLLATPVFAQDPLYAAESNGNPGENYKLLSAAAAEPDVESVGSAPYVEATTEYARENIRLVLDLAWQNHLHADFHLDYNLDPSAEPLIWFLLDELNLRIQSGSWHPDAHVCVGHATRLTLFSDVEWERYRDLVQVGRLPVTLVGLPQSDLYMMGRDQDHPRRGTLNPIKVSQKYGLAVAMAVNNVGNAFTPQGPVDPLALCPLGVATFQAATPTSCRTLLEAVTTIARQSIGRRPSALVPRIGDVADFVLLHGNTSIQSVVCSPSYDRTTVKNGKVVARRSTTTWREDGIRQV